MTSPLRIGTRNSDLALWQARHVAALLELEVDVPPVELVEIETGGDRAVDRALSTLPGKAFFTKEIERALVDDEVDLAVHSLKDLATETPAGLTLAAVLARSDPRDVLVSRTGADLDSLPPGARVGTSSLRRRALVARRRPDLQLADLRGNVPTRLKKLDSGRFDAIVLAAAGLKRLGLLDRITAYLDPLDHLPAVGQGAIAIQARDDDEATLAWLRTLDDTPTRQAVTAERSLLRRLEGGCQIPLGALATLDGDRLELRAMVCSLDGQQSVEGRRTGRPEQADQLGRELAEELLDRGADSILEHIRGRSEETA